MAHRRLLPLAVAALATGLTTATLSTAGATEVVTQTQDNTGAAAAIGLAGVDEINAQLRQLADQSDRVEVEVIGTSLEGRDISLATVTTADDPTDVPAVLFTANLHGDEWEGSDAALRLIDDLATTNDDDELSWLEANRVSFIVTGNPDGRYTNTRENAAGIDINRDFLSATQPETQAIRDTVLDLNPIALVDLHGYVNGTLVEPTTPPHAENAEFDLLIENSYPLGLAIESDLESLSLNDADDVRDPQLPIRDWADGWDGWPPIFLPQYASLHGSVALTVELPLRTNNDSYDLDQEEIDRRSSVNIAVAEQVMRSTLDYSTTEQASLLANQKAVFARGEAGQAQQPATDLDLDIVGAEDVYLTDFPAAYVIPQGSHQRSDAAAARLVESLIAHDVEVQTATEGFRIDDVAYPTGSYVITTDQAKRGMAGAMLGPGSDLSTRVEHMYDVAAWSMTDLWGADVITVSESADVPQSLEQVDQAEATGGLSGSGPWVMPLADPANVLAMNDLLAAGATLSWTPDGHVLIQRDAAQAAQQVAQEHGIDLVTASENQRSVARNGALDDELVVAAAATAGDAWALEAMGFSVVEISEESLNDGFAWTNIDAAFVSQDLDLDNLEADAVTALQSFLSDGGGLVGQGIVGADLNEDLAGLELQASAGPTHANGIVTVDSVNGPIATAATERTFVYEPVWFSEIGPEVRVDQRLASDPLASGFWRAQGTEATGPSDAGGNPLVVHGVDTSGPTSGGRFALFGSDPLFRGHPQGQFPLVGAAIAWSALDTDDEVAR